MAFVFFYFFWSFYLFSGSPGPTPEKKTPTKDKSHISSYSQTFQNEDQSFRSYKGQRKSYLDWSKINPFTWSNYFLWYKDCKVKEATPLWRIHLRDTSHRERMGRSISCIGKCTLYRDRGKIGLKHLSLIIEGDEIETFENSYLWVFLFDGTVFRLGPSSRMRLNELIWGPKETLYYVHFSRGLLHWKSRDGSFLPPSHLMETDTLFLPLPLKEANPPPPTYPTPKSFLDGRLQQKRHLSEINELIKKNNHWAMKRYTKTLLVAPNGTFLGKNLQINLFHQINKSSLFQSIDKSKVFFRGLFNEKSAQLEPKAWYEMGHKGRELTPLEQAPPELSKALLNTKRPFTIIKAREIFLNKYSKKIFQTLSPKKLATMHGVRLWQGESSFPNQEMGRRLQFLLQYTRKEQTHFLRSSAKIFPTKDHEAKFSEKYYKKAYFHYLKQLLNYPTTRQ